MSDLPDIEELFNPKPTEVKQTQPVKRDLASLTPKTSRLSSNVGQSITPKPFTSTSTLPKIQTHPIRPSQSKGPINLASSLKLVSENSLAKSQAAIEREGMKDLRASTRSQAIVDAARIKHEPFQIQTQAMQIFSLGEEAEFASLEERLDAAQVLREDSNAAFFVQLSERLRWIWLKKEIHKDQ